MATQSKPVGARGARKGFSVWTLLLRMRSFIFLILVLGFFSLNAPNFITTNNFLIMSKHAARYAIIAIGMTYVILAGGIDLSVGSIVGIVGMIVGWMLERGVTIGDKKVYFSVWFILLVGMAVGAFVGAVNGVLTTRFKVAPLSRLWEPSTSPAVLPLCDPVARRTRTWPDNLNWGTWVSKSWVTIDSWGSISRSGS